MEKRLILDQRMSLFLLSPLNIIVRGGLPIQSPVLYEKIPRRVSAKRDLK